MYTNFLITNHLPTTVGFIQQSQGHDGKSRVGITSIDFISTKKYWARVKQSLIVLHKLEFAMTFYCQLRCDEVSEMKNTHNSHLTPCCVSQGITVPSSHSFPGLIHIDDHQQQEMGYERVTGLVYRLSMVRVR